jgi:hypothetical protein
MAGTHFIALSITNQWLPNNQMQKTGSEAGFYAEIPARF